MRCPNCDLENDITSTYCERCGTLLQSISEYEIPEQSEYQVPPPPPLNGHNPSPPPAPPVYDYAEAPSTFTASTTPPPNQYSDPFPSSVSPDTSNATGMSTPVYVTQRRQQPHRIGIFSGILYFLGVLLIAIGIVNMLTTFSTSAIIILTGRLLSSAVLLVSIVLFVYLVRRHTTLTHWWTRLLWIIVLTIGAFTLLVIIELLNPSKFVNMFATGGMFFLFGLAWCAIAVW